MNDILLVVPSRGRPHNAERLRRAWEATTEGCSELRFLVDLDDPTRHDYPEDLTDIGIPGRLVVLTNRCAIANLDRFRVFGSIGDDHLPQTRWEGPVLDAFDEGAHVVYGDDGVHGERIPTAFFMSSAAVRARGHMIPPTFEHLFADNQALDLGRAADCVRYLPEVKITHLHPIVGLAPDDETYRRGTGPEVWARDEAAYRAWVADGLPRETELIRALTKG